MPTLTYRPTAETALIEAIEALAPQTPWTPEHDLIVGEREVRLSVDLPGVLAKNLHVVMHEGRLHIGGHRIAAYAPKALDHRTTRRTGRFALDVEIPAWVDPQRVFQAFEAGILTVVLPRRRESQPSAHGPL